MIGAVRKLNEDLKVDVDKIYVMQAEKNLKLLHENDDGFICIAEKTFNKLWFQYHYKYDELIKNIGKALSEDANIYITPNSFYKPFRRIENIRHLNSLYIDIDFYKVDKLKNMDHREVMKKIDKEFFKTGKLPEPTFALYTGNGLAYYWLIKPCPIGVLPLWNVCQRFFVEQLESVGGDTNSIDSARVMKLAGSFHTNSLKRAEIYIFNNKLTYDLADIQRDYLPQLNPDTESVGDRVHKRRHFTSEEYFERIRKNAVKHSRSRKQNKVLKLYNQLNLHYTRIMDIVKLQSMRKGLCRNSKGELVKDGSREFMCFLYRYWYCLYSRDIEQALSCTKDFNNNFINPLTDYEVENITLSAVKAYEEWKADEDIKNDPSIPDEEKKKRMGKTIGNIKFFHKGYNYNNSTLIRKLHISDEEQRELKTIISKTERKRRQSVREKHSRRDINGMTIREKNYNDRLNQIRELYEAGLKQKDIAERLNINKGTVSRNIKKIKEEIQKSNEKAVS